MPFQFDRPCSKCQGRMAAVNTYTINGRLRRRLRCRNCRHEATIQEVSVQNGVLKVPDRDIIKNLSQMNVSKRRVIFEKVFTNRYSK